jgi:integrase
LEPPRTDGAQKSPDSGGKPVRFPKVIKHRKAVAKIYGKSASYPFYRVCGYVSGKRRMESHATYSDALAAAENLAREIAAGSQVLALTPGEASDARAALEVLTALRQSTGLHVSLHAAATEYAEAARKLKARSLAPAIEGYVANVATVKRLDLTEAVEQFIAGREHKTQAAPGKRAALSAGYAYIVAMWLREFAGTFKGTAVCDLTKDLLNAYMAPFGKLSARTRNGRRTVVGMFLKWAAKQDLLPANHRLLEADGMAQETYEPDSLDYYRPEELAALLHAASGIDAHRHLLPIIALCGLAGLRLQEAARLDWADVWRVAGHVEISKTKSKNRSRRLVEICPALAAWLEPYRASAGPLWRFGLEKFHTDFNALREALRETLDIPARRNGLRHAYATYSFALTGNENAVAAAMGNSPNMIHGHYKGLATKAEAEAWFAVTPAPAAANVIPLVQAVA